MIVFISYNDRNYDAARALAVQMGMLGHDVWFEEKSVSSDSSWKQVFDGIKDCDTFVFAATQFSMSSYAQQLELGYASALGKPSLQVLLEDPVNDRVLAELSALPMVDYRHGNDSLAALAAGLENLPVVGQRALAAKAIRPELIVPLSKLYNDVAMLPTELAAQFAIYYNLREFLQRYETFHDAKNILLRLHSHPSVYRQVAREIESTFREVKSLRAKRKALRRRNKVLKAASVMVGVPVILFGFVRGGQMIPTFFASDHTATLQATELPTTEAPTDLPTTGAVEPTKVTQSAAVVEVALNIPASVSVIDEPTETEADNEVVRPEAMPAVIAPAKTVPQEVAMLPKAVAAKAPKSAGTLKIRAALTPVEPDPLIESLVKLGSIPRFKWTKF